MINRLLMPFAAAALVTTSINAEVPSFEKVVLDANIGNVCYAVIAADVNDDGQPDAVAISENEAVWYQNPNWTRHSMIKDAVPKDHVCIAAHDIDGDGLVDFALGAGWPKNGGTIHWLRRGETLNEPWQVFDISSEPWTHRMRWADVLGRGSKQLVVTPLNGSGDNGIRLLAFPVPADPETNQWKPVIVDGSLNRAHNQWHLPAAGDDGAEQTLTASEEGITWIRKSEANGFQVTRIAGGAESDAADQRGSGEVKTGRLSPSTSLIATIEPMHGNQVVVYVGKNVTDQNQQRIVLDDTFSQGHAIWCADLDGDGSDEVIAAYRNPGNGPVKGPGIFIYQADDDRGQHWTRTTLDPMMACEDLWCEDFNGDGKVDILAGGRATHDVNLYLNQSVTSSTTPKD
ncbi:FG-GAP repeat domain-containing protein [Novipirellula sp. SH528]|uniref:FG-GAP repeat domain-containing protein n=1 Tax=Novipirellula sp. SH528 TaxID=3454466 RepID=UPI003FA17A74